MEYPNIRIGVDNCPNCNEKLTYYTPLQCPKNIIDSGKKINTNLVVLSVNCPRCKSHWMIDVYIDYRENKNDK